MLKGTATIELTNVKTGEKEVYTEENMVTNALRDLLTDDPLALANCCTGCSTQMAPITSNALSGILLFENALEEDPDKYIPPNNNVIVGYANTAVNTTADPKRGSGNQTEQGFTEDNKGYKFVFDFTTSQANGTISAIGLTSDAAGLCGRGSKYTAYNPVRGTRYCEKEVAEFSTNTVPSDDLVILSWLTALVPEKNEAISVWTSDANTIECKRFGAALTSVGFRESAISRPSKKILEEKTITTTTFGKSVSSSSTRTFYNAFVDGGDRYIWGFEHANNAGGNSSGNASVNWIKIKIDDFTFEEGTWTLAAQLNAFAYTYDEGNMFTKMNTLAYQPSSIYWRGVCKWKNCCVHNGYLYCFNYSKTGVYKIELANPSNIKFMPHPDGQVLDISIDSPSMLRGDTTHPVLASANGLDVRGDDIVFQNGVIENDEIIPVGTKTSISWTQYDLWLRPYPSNYPVGFAHSVSPRLNVGLNKVRWYATGYAPDSSTLNASLTMCASLMPNMVYLATINNLSKPVQKTADKTMKITYIIREEE